jgi:GTP pyrophosphokinase
VLVVGVDSLLTTLARCCRPAPPDAIGGFVTRGRAWPSTGATAATCATWRRLARARDRGGLGPAGRRPGRVYPLDVVVEAADRQGLLRDISEVFAKEKINVTGVNTQSVRATAAAPPG